mmetsp:Transcript_77291/g.145745  ORF Transcript_77291/g.145745 Transcript_77291/m.145745 type:complete len:609 (-) Transcript_77291:84-1910(-)
MAGTDFNELKAVVTKSLETSGVLSQIRAQLRASVYQAIHERGKPPGSQLLDGLSAALCAELIAEFFEFHGFQHSLRVFQTEAQLTLARRGRSDVAADAGLRAVMVGCSILEQLLGRRREPNDAEKSRAPNQVLEGKDQGGVAATTAATATASALSDDHMRPLGVTADEHEAERRQEEEERRERHRVQQMEEEMRQTEQRRQQLTQASERTTGWRRQKPPDLDVADEQLAEPASGWQRQKSAESVVEGALRVDRESGSADGQLAEPTNARQHQKPAEADDTSAKNGSSSTHAESGHQVGCKEEPWDSARDGESGEQSTFAASEQGAAAVLSAPQRLPGASTLTASALSSSALSPASAHGTLRGSHMRLPPLGESAPGLPQAIGPGARLAPLTSPVSSSASLAQAVTQGTPPQTPSGTASPAGTGTPAGILSPAGSSATLGNSLGEDRGPFGSLARSANPLPPLSAGISGSTEVSGVRSGRRRVKDKESKRVAERNDWSLQHDSSASTMDATGADASSVTSVPQWTAASRLATALKKTAANGAPGSDSEEEEGYSEVMEDVLGTSASCDSFPPGPLSLIRQGSESISVVDSVSGVDSSLPAMDEVSSEQG